MIKTNNLTVKYNKNNGIFDVNILIDHGAIAAIIGHSGCGKTTLLHAIANLISLTKGDIQLSTRQHKKAVPGLVQQKDALFPWYTVQKNIALGLSNRTYSRKTILEILNQVELTNVKDHYPLQISGGQRQRVSLGRTLISSPDILLMDEPTASLDSFTKERLQNLILRLHKQTRRTTLFATHSIEEAVFLADEIFVMKNGKIIDSLANPIAHTPNIRQEKSFHETVIKVRKLMERIHYE